MSREITLRKAQQTTFSQLPEEIVRHILGFVNPMDLVVLCRVSKSWRSFINDKAVLKHWQSLLFSSFDFENTYDIKLLIDLFYIIYEERYWTEILFRISPEEELIIRSGLGTSGNPLFDEILKSFNHLGDEVYKVSSFISDLFKSEPSGISGNWQLTATTNDPLARYVIKRFNSSLDMACLPKVHETLQLRQNAEKKILESFGIYIRLALFGDVKYFIVLKEVVNAMTTRKKRRKLFQLTLPLINYLKFSCWDPVFIGKNSHIAQVWRLIQSLFEKKIIPEKLFDFYAMKFFQDSQIMLLTPSALRDLLSVKNSFELLFKVRGIDFKKNCELIFLIDKMNLVLVDPLRKLYFYDFLLNDNDFITTTNDFMSKSQSELCEHTGSYKFIKKSLVVIKSEVSQNDTQLHAMLERLFARLQLLEESTPGPSVSKSFGLFAATTDVSEFASTTVAMEPTRKGGGHLSFAQIEDLLGIYVDEPGDSDSRKRKRNESENAAEQGGEPSVKRVKSSFT